MYHIATKFHLTSPITSLTMHDVLMQFVFAPTFIGIFLSTLMTLEGRPLEVIPKLQQVLLNILESGKGLGYLHLNLISCRSGFPQFLQIGNYGFLSNSSTSVSCHNNSRWTHNLILTPERKKYSLLLLSIEDNNLSQKYIIRVTDFSFAFFLVNFCRFLQPTLLPWYGMWFSHIKLTKKLLPNR